MVKRSAMLMPMVFLMLLLLMAAPAHSETVKSKTGKPESQLDVHISSTDKQWGQFLRVTLRYHGSEKLGDIDLHPWQQFVAIDVDGEYGDEDEQGNAVQVLQLRLHPRMTGKFQLPSVKLGDAVSRRVPINIDQPVIKDTAIKLDWQISTLSPWQREAVLVRLQLKTDDYAAHVRLDSLPDSLQGKRFLSRVLKTERHILADGSFSFKTGWIIYPMAAGVLELDLPAIRYQIAGSDRRKFYLPLQTLQVKALPNYLPPTLPIGSLEADSQIGYDRYGVNGHGVRRWLLSISSDGLIPYGVPDLDAQLAQLSEQDVADIEIVYTQRSDYDDVGDHSLYSAPLPDWLLPFGKDLELTLRFFDTDSGRLNELTHHLPRQWIMPYWAWWLLAASGFIAAGFILWKLWPQLQLQAARLKIYRDLRNAKDVEGMRRIILDGGRYATLSEWMSNNPKRKNVVSRLNCYCFSTSGADDVKPAVLQQLKSEILKLV